LRQIFDDHGGHRRLADATFAGQGDSCCHLSFLCYWL
jgi:hypothetical protein